MSLVGISALGLLVEDNLIQNGDMRVDQRNEGASVTIATGTTPFSADRWKTSFVASTSSAGNPTIQQGAISSNPAGLGLPESIKLTCSGTPSTTVPAALSLFLEQAIEGPDVQDLGLGTAQAGNVTLSFWVKCSVAGTYCAALSNSAANRAYVTTFTVNTSGTWQKIVLFFTGDVSGTWLTDLGTKGLVLRICLAGGSTFQATANTWSAGNFYTTTAQTQLTATASATFEMTAVKLERGAVATAFISAPAAENFQNLRRYYQKSFPKGTAPAQSGGVTGALTIKNPIALGDPSIYLAFEPPMFASPTVTTYNPSAANANWRDITAGADSTVAVDAPSTKSANGVIIATSGTVSTLGDYLGIHFTADSGA